MRHGSALHLAVFTLVTLQAVLAQSGPQGNNPIEKKVDCSKGQSIGSAVANLEAYKSYIIRVSGECTENVRISNFEGISLDIIGEPGTIVNGMGGGPAVGIDNSRRVAVRSLTINAAPGWAGIGVGNCLPCQVHDSTVNMGGSVGIDWFATRGLVRNTTVSASGNAPLALNLLGASELILEGFRAIGPGVAPGAGSRTGRGIVVDQSSTIRIGGGSPASHIEEFLAGIDMRNGSSVITSNSCASAGRTQPCLELVRNDTGVQITSAQATLAAVSMDGNKDGIRVERDAALSLGPLANINSSGRYGIVVSHNSHATITSNPAGTNNVSGSGTRDLAVASLSTARFQGFTNKSTVSNLACDLTSRITGLNQMNQLPPPTINCADTSGDPDPMP